MREQRFEPSTRCHTYWMPPLVHAALSSTTVGFIVCLSVGDRSLLLMGTISDFTGTSYFMLSRFSAGAKSYRTLLVALY